MARRLSPADGNVLSAIFRPLCLVFHQPAGDPGKLGVQNVVPWDPRVHQTRNAFFRRANLFLLHDILLRVAAARR